MCGLFGIISKDHQNLKEQGLEALATTLHRGPDHTDFFCEDHVFLGLNRLSIFDLSAQANQPFQFEHWTIIFNGAIYNHLELKKELQVLGHQFRTDSDTEVLLKSFIQWGHGFENRLNGMWAFIIHNQKIKKTYISRDRYGIKPLYYIKEPTLLAFSSEIKAFYKLKNWKVIVKHELILNPDIPDLYNNINEFPKGCYAVVDENLEFAIYTYYSYAPHTQEISFEAAKEKLLFLLKDSIKLRTRGDVDLGLSLSGGMDSGSIAALLDIDVLCISAIFEEKEANEFQHIQSILENLKHTGHTISPNGRDLVSKIKKLTEVQETPIHTLSLSAQNEVFAKAKELGIKVMLGGQGADEQLYGYNSFIKQYIHLSRSRGIREYTHALTSTAINHPSFIKSLFKKREPSKFEKAKACKDSFSSLEEYAWHTFNSLTLPKLLHYEDRNAMSHGIESRLPFLDYRIVEFCFSLPSSFHFEIGNRKKLLQASMADKLPKSLLKRKDKMAYNVPQSKWVNQSKSDLLEIVSQLNLDIKGQFQLNRLDNHSLLYLTSLYFWREYFKP